MSAQKRSSLRSWSHALATRRLSSSGMGWPVSSLANGSLVLKQGRFPHHGGLERTGGPSGSPRRAALARSHLASPTRRHANPRAISAFGSAWPEGATRWSSGDPTVTPRRTVCRAMRTGIAAKVRCGDGPRYGSYPRTKFHPLGHRSSNIAQRQGLAAQAGSAGPVCLFSWQALIARPSRGEVRACGAEARLFAAWPTQHRSAVPRTSPRHQ